LILTVIKREQDIFGTMCRDNEEGQSTSMKWDPVFGSSSIDGRDQILRLKIILTGCACVANTVKQSKSDS
jgi:hypothetical protein